MEEMGLTDGQVRGRASVLQIKAMGASTAWSDGVAKRAKTVTGRKRPEHSKRMKELKAAGVVLNHEVTPELRKKISDSAKKRIAENGHPKGYLGHRHTDASKFEISKKSTAAWARKTEEEIADFVMKGIKTRSINGAIARHRPETTWKAGWREIGGTRKYYRSRWEANYGMYLEWLKSNGQISDWLHEPVTFWFEGIKRGCVSYLPDFWVLENNGGEAYHEVKGWMDSRSRTKIDRMARYHPDVILIVIGKNEYREIEKKLSKLIDGWES